MSKLGKGFLTLAQNSKVDYLRLAYVQAMSIKLTMPDSKYAVIVDRKTLESITEKHRAVFDYVITLPEDFANTEEWKLSNEWQVFNLTPFKETIKLESDILFTRSIEHWWNAFRLRDVVLSTGCRDYQQKLSQSRNYRRVFDDNHLPDTYNGIMYFRYSQTAFDFFDIARQIYQQWEQISQTLKNCRDPHPTTDVVYALAAQIMGRETCTLPIDFINFVHMKPNINNWTESVEWTKTFLYETDLPMIRINNVNQYHPLHYYEKDFVTTQIVEEYENVYARRA